MPASRLPTAREPFRAITALLTERGDLRTLDRQYRTMITRLSGGPHQTLEATLFDSLTGRYRALGHSSAADAAAEMAKELRARAAAASD